MKVSIIVPVYNVEKYIKRCLDSIQRQTFLNWEAIVVNDGSTDESGRICQEYALSDNRFIYIEQNNQGQSGARNTGLRIARGDYVCFVDSDDWVEPFFIEKLYQAVYSSDTEIAVCGYFHSTEERDTPFTMLDYDKFLSHDEFVHQMAINKIESFAWNKIYSVRLLKEHPYRLGVYFEDVLLWNELMKEIGSVSVVDEPLYHYFMRENSTVHMRSLKRERDYFNAFRERYELNFIGKEEKTFILKTLMVSYFYIVQAYGKEYISDNEFKKYLGMQDQYDILEARKEMRFAECIRYDMAMHFPKFYQWIVKTVRR